MLPNFMSPLSPLQENVSHLIQIEFPAIDILYIKELLRGSWKTCSWLVGSSAPHSSFQHDGEYFSVVPKRDKVSSKHPPAPHLAPEMPYSTDWSSEPHEEGKIPSAFSVTPFNSLPQGNSTTYKVSQNNSPPPP
eukprot:Phypoly_transcript_16833.p1 GENE.Phypoly_transcript_16833~~Phypoly_transcript_16833.p1  ORF type:complete len:134 (-),score=20.69 Phypoly_transcript_16833:105-506(-)